MPVAAAAGVSLSELRPVIIRPIPMPTAGCLEWLHQFNDPQVGAALEARAMTRRLH